MKKKLKSNLNFKKSSIVELNQNSMKKIFGGKDDGNTGNTIDLTIIAGDSSKRCA